ncbi:hypothetical protein R5R35_003948 [Gryllus longicercus]|uniref:Spaetzle domain-containing protein n=1 Tax=Gryllus longicercus TaxID=2509291 RepID=A0AAN9VMC7_9ORTH
MLDILKRLTFYCILYASLSSAKEAEDTKAAETDLESHGSPGIVILYSKSSPRKEYEYPDNFRLFENPSTINALGPSNKAKHGAPQPSCANDEPYCLFNREYPEDKVHEIINNYHDDVHHMYHGLNHYPIKDYITHDNFTHGYRHKGSFVCESDVAYIRPGWAKNWKNEWVAVVNTNKYPQSIRIEKCKYGGKKCEYLPSCYKSFCVQRYTYVKLLCVDPFNPHYRPVVDVFEIPSGCSCFVEDFVYY